MSDYALIVGIEDYQTRHAARLLGPSFDALRFALWLRGRDVPAENIIVIQNKSPDWGGRLGEAYLEVEEKLLQGGVVLETVPTYSAFKNAWRDRILQTRPSGGDDQLWVYWSGHGVTFPRREEALLCSDVQFGDPTFIYLSELKASLRSSQYHRFRRQYLLIDACSTRLDYRSLQISSTRQPELFEELNGVHQVLLHAVAVGETAKAEEGGSLFTRLLLKCLENGVNFEDDGLQLWSDLKAAIQAERQNASALPRLVIESDRLKDSWPKPNADRSPAIVPTPVNPVISFFRQLFSPFKSRYLRHIRNRYRHFDTQTLSATAPFSLDMREVYVELLLGAKPPHLVVPNPIGTQRKTANAHDIWWYLGASEHAESHFFILGAPGTGKSTLLRHLAIAIAERPKRGFKKIPIFLSFKNDVYPNVASSLADIIQIQLSRFKVMPPSEWFENQLENGRCILLLDGLDEVSDQAGRAAVSEWVEVQIQTYPLNRFIVTSRPSAYTKVLPGMTVMEVQPLSPTQARSFIESWFLAIERKTPKQAKSQPDNAARASAKSLLLERLDSSEIIAEFAANPLLLTIACTLALYGQTLSGRRIDLYSEILKVFLSRLQDPKRSRFPVNVDNSRIALQSLAWVMMESEIPEIKVDDALAVLESKAALPKSLPYIFFLEMLHEASGLFLEKEDRVYAFAHLSFQEYLAAVYARKNDCGKKLLENIGRPWWRQTLIFYAALGGADDVISSCLEDDRPSVAGLSLALEAAEESDAVGHAARARLDAVRSSWVNDPDTERRTLAAEVELALRLRRMIRQREGVYLSTTSITVAEYQLFLDERASAGQFRYMDHWTTKQNLKGQDPVNGVRSSDAIEFCRWLTEREQGYWRYRIPREDESVGTHWAIKGAELYRDIPRSVVTAVSRQDLTKWLFDDFARAFRLRDLLEDKTSTSSEKEIFGMLPRFGIENYSPIFAVKVGNLFSEPFPASTLVSAIKGALLHESSMESAWDPGLADSMTPKDSDWFLAQETLDVAPDLELAKANLQNCFDIDQIFNSVGRLIDGNPVASQSDSDIPNLSTLHRTFDESLGFNCRFLQERRQWSLDPAEDIGNMVRWVTRLDAVIAAGMLLLQPEMRIDQARLDCYRSLYVALVILELRIQDPSLAFEGIRVVKERDERN